MFFRILKRDLKRKKTMNIILLLFMTLATMFVASSVTNILTVMNGTDYYFDKAGVGDYVVITMGDGAVGALDNIFQNEPAIKDYRMENIIYASQDNFSFNGIEVKTKNTAIFQSIETSSLHFFHENDEEVTGIPKGQVYVSGDFLEKNDLSIGDELRIKHSDVDITLKLAGKVKDALLGSDYMGNTRFIMNDEDYMEFAKDEFLSLHYSGQICYIDTDEVAKVTEVLSDATNIGFDESRSTIKMCYIMDMIVAFVILVLSICLIIVSFVVLKFTITFTISEEFREIGVMKAIGIKNLKIRSLYIIKYLLIALIGAIIGFFASIPFGNMLIKSVSENMVLGNNGGIMTNIFGALFVVFVIVLYAYICTGKVKKSSPVDAIRNGQTGERYKKKTVYRIGKSHTNTSVYLALNDIISSPKRFLTIITSFCICCLLVLMIVNTTTTMKSKNLITTFCKESDVYVTNVKGVMEYMNGRDKEAMIKRLDELSSQLTKSGMPSTLCIELQYKYNITFNEFSNNITCQQGVNTQAIDYEYTEGVAPINANEVAITSQISELTGAKIGDVITIDYGNRQEKCIVTAYFQSMNQFGEIIRLHEDADTDFSHIASALSYQIDFTDNPSDQEINERIKKIKVLWDNEYVFNTTDYCIDCISVVDTMENVKLLLLTITIVVVILVTILMERSFITDEKGQIAILKAIGFRDSAIIRWHVCRFTIVAFISVALAVALSMPMTKLCITPIFGMMGANKINFNIEPLLVFVFYPGIVLFTTVIVAWITAFYIKTIKSSDTASVE